MPLNSSYPSEFVLIWKIYRADKCVPPSHRYPTTSNLGSLVPRARHLPGVRISTLGIAVPPSPPLPPPTTFQPFNQPKMFFFRLQALVIRENSAPIAPNIDLVYRTGVLLAKRFDQIDASLFLGTVYTSSQIYYYIYILQLGQFSRIFEETIITLPTVSYKGSRKISNVLLQEYCQRLVLIISQLSASFCPATLFSQTTTG